MAERVDWGGAGEPSIPWIGPRNTREEVDEFIDILGSNVMTETFDITDTIVDGQNAVVIVSLKQRINKTSVLFESDVAFQLKVVDGRIVRYRYYEDSLTLAQAYGAI